MTKVKVNNYEIRQAYPQGGRAAPSALVDVIPGALRFFRTREEAVTAIRKWPPPGLQSIKA